MGLQRKHGHTRPGPSWKDPGYNTNSEPGWKAGQALFGNDGAGVYDGAGSPFAGQGINGFLTPLDRSSGRITFYFRKNFTWTGPTAGVVLKSTYVVDDGMVVYLNGQEIHRAFMSVAAPDAVVWDTLGQNPDPEGTRFSIELPATALVEGDNVLAVEVHQSSATSSDVAFAMSREGAPPVPPTIVDASQPASRNVFANRGADLVREAVFLSGLRRIDTIFSGKPQEPWRPTTLMHCVQDNWIDPDVVVDITPFWDRKMEALMCFRSQFYDPTSTEPESPIATREFLPFLEGRHRAMGRIIHASYGEGFTVQRAPGVRDVMELA